MEDRSNIDVKSNVLLKSKITDSRGWIAYAPIELLYNHFSFYQDVRLEPFLTKQQLEEKRRGLLREGKIIDNE